MTMELLLAIVIGTIFTAGCYLMLQRHILKLIFGIVLMSHAANLLIFTAAGLTSGKTPIITSDALKLQTPYPDPLPQALILTAIVISFGILAFTIVLARKTFETTGSADTDVLRSTDT